jgi:hypothetical protein
MENWWHHRFIIMYEVLQKGEIIYSVAELHHFCAAPGKNFHAALAAPAPALTLLYSKAKFFKRTKV